MRFDVDPWDPGYGAGLDTELGESGAEVDPSVEFAPGQWRPVPPDPAVSPPARVLFVDGVRRIDARVWVAEPPRPGSGTGDAAVPGLCASYAAGVVRCGPGGAALSTALVRRSMITTVAEVADIVTAAGTYRAVPTGARADIAPTQLLSLALQRQLGELEVLAAGQARDATAGTADDLLVIDGPLRGRGHLPRVLGFVKSHRSDYLPAALGEVVARLAPGERTPVFSLGSSWRRYTWYLRLPGAPGSPWAGVVRVECGPDLAPADAVRAAGLSQRVLPRYASTAYKDTRAPQNLYPIGGLEKALRRRLGDPALLYRALRRAAAGSAITGTSAVGTSAVGTSSAGGGPGDGRAAGQDGIRGTAAAEG